MGGKVVVVSQDECDVSEEMYDFEDVRIYGNELNIYYILNRVILY